MKRTTNRKLPGHLGILLILGLAFILLKVPNPVAGRPDPLEFSLRSMLQAGDILIILEDNGVIRDIVAGQEINILPWDSEGENDTLLLSLADQFCSSAASNKPAQRIFLAWNHVEKDTIYTLGPRFRSTYVFFDIKRVLGTEGRFFRLLPRQDVVSKYCSAKSTSTNNLPMLIILHDLTYPMINPVEAGRFTFISLKTAAKPPFQMVEQTFHKQGIVYLDGAIEIDATHPFFQAYAINPTPIGDGTIFQIAP